MNELDEVETSNPTQHYVAFLRGINVGGHRVKMDRLRELFEAFGLSEVETYIASGNVLFSTPKVRPVNLELELDEYLTRELGFPTRVYLRSPEELTAIARYIPFTHQELAAAGWTLYVVFLRYDTNDKTNLRIEALSTADDRLRVRGRETYWLRRGKISESPLTVPMVQKAAVGALATRRKATTIERLAAKLTARAAAEPAQDSR